VVFDAGDARLIDANRDAVALCGLPDREAKELMDDAARLDGIAIDRCCPEEALRGSEAQFRGLFESVMEGVYQSSSGGRLIPVNPAARGEFARHLEATGEVRNAECALRSRDGQQIVVLESARPVSDADGRIDYMNPVAEQMTRWSLGNVQGRPIGELLRLVNDATRARVPGVARCADGADQPAPSSRSRRTPTAWPRC
jgi:PAS domain-containing protein